MTATALMEIKEAEIRKHYPQTYQLLSGFDYAPRIGRASEWSCIFSSRKSSAASPSFTSADRTPLRASRLANMSTSTGR